MAMLLVNRPNEGLGEEEKGGEERRRRRKRRSVTVCSGSNSLLFFYVSCFEGPSAPAHAWCCRG